jgi:hypothetical protein
MLDPNYKMTPAETIRFLRSLRDAALADGDEEEAAFWHAEADLKSGPARAQQRRLRGGPGGVAEQQAVTAPATHFGC